MRFIGNKENLIAKIYDFICECGVVCDDLRKANIKHAMQNSQKTFFDMFSGSASVGRFFKAKGFQIYSCDLLYFSYCLQMAYLCNNKEPKFLALNEILPKNKASLFLSPYQNTLEFLNNLKYQKGFIYQNYAPSGSKNLAKPRMYFSDENAQKIDAICTQIKEWKMQDKITQNEYFILLASLIESVSFFANVAGVYAAFCKVWDKRALKPFVLKEISLLESEIKHFCFCGNSLEILASHKEKPFDILYLDPPYNHRQYAPNYHLIETIARYDNPQIQGVAGLRKWQEQKSNFCNPKSALKELEKIALCKKYKNLVLSYNSEGIMHKSQIDELLKPLGKVHFKELNYPRFKSKAGGAQKFVKEFVWIVQI